MFTVQLSVVIGNQLRGNFVYKHAFVCMYVCVSVCVAMCITIEYNYKASHY